MEKMIVGGSGAGKGVGERSGSRIAVVLEPGRSGAAALGQAAALAAMPDSELTVVAIAPQATGPRCCGPSPDAFNCAVRDEVANDLEKAAELIGSTSEAANFRLLVEGSDPPLETWVAQGGFDVVLLPARRRVLRPWGHPAERPLRRCADVDVHIVGASPRRSGSTS